MGNLNKAFELFDAYNKTDPNVIIWQGVEYPAEYFYALQLYNWVKNLHPNAGDTLLLASRSQHIGRWKIARNEYPEGKAGYYKWRTELAKFHAATVHELMLEAGYNEEETKPVQHIILKENLKADDEVQVMENALCLVFLQFQYDDFVSKHDDEMLIRILRKTWKKMNEPGRNAALSLTFNGRAKELLIKALSEV
jgi:hypothetical protein